MYAYDLATQATHDREAELASAAARNRATWKRLREAQTLEAKLSAARSRLSEGQDPTQIIRNARHRIVSSALTLRTVEDFD